MTVVRTYRAGCTTHRTTKGTDCLVCWPAPSHERIFPTGDPMADAWADFMAFAGYVVEVEG